MHCPIWPEIALTRSAQWMEPFHRTRPGITEEILGSSYGRDQNDNPYRWLLEALPECDRVLDLACGSAPGCNSVI